MKTICWLAFMSLSIISHGQRTFWDDDKSIWFVANYVMGGNLSSIEKITIPKDSVQWNGTYYKKFGETMIREDGVGTLFCVLSGKEYEVINFRLQVGDTFTSYANQNNQKTIVIIQDKVKKKIGADSLWVMTGRAIVNADHSPKSVGIVTFVESIGCISHSHPVLWDKYLSVLDLYKQVSCFIRDQEYVLNPSNSSCDQEELGSLNKVWYTYYSNDNGDHKIGRAYTYLGKDTTVQNKKYAIIVDNLGGRTFLRFENDRYYKLFSDGSEKLLYNTKAKVGDSAFLVGNMTIDTAKQIDYIVLDNIIRKVTYGDHDQFISGIGTLNQVLFSDKKIMTPEYIEQNICYKSNEGPKNEYIYHFQPFYTLKSCEPTSSIGKIMPVNSLHLSQVGDEIILSSDSYAKIPIDISIYALNTMKVYSESLVFSKKHFVNLSPLQPGVYFIMVNGKNISEHMKFFKEAK